LKLFGAAAAVGAVPAVAGADAAVAYAETHGHRLDAAFQRVVDTIDDFRFASFDFARQADATALAVTDFERSMTSVRAFADPSALTIEKLEETMKAISGNMGVPIDLTPRYLLTSQARAAELRDLMSTKVAERGREFEFALSRQLNLGGIDLVVAPLMPRDHALIVDRFQPSFLEPPGFARAIHEHGRRRS
jgi:hypothetical protein